MRRPTLALLLAFPEAHAGALVIEFGGAGLGPSAEAVHVTAPLPGCWAVDQCWSVSLLVDACMHNAQMVTPLHAAQLLPCRQLSTNTLCSGCTGVMLKK